MRIHAFRLLIAGLFLFGGSAPPAHSTPANAASLRKLIADTMLPLMQRYGIPGMAIGVVAAGRGHLFNFGVMSKESGAAVTDDTLFEIGSVSKTFTATLVSYAAVAGRLSLSDAASTRLPVLRGSSFDRITLMDLGTHTSGGLPLQVPDAIQDDDQLMRYFQTWTPTYPPGAVRTYANPSIGLLGLIAATRLGNSFDTLMEHHVFQALGLHHTYLQVPATEMANYAQGYTAADRPVRMALGLLGSEAYGIRATLGDMVRFIGANMGLVPLQADLRRAIMDTHTTYHRVGSMMQGLIWEEYGLPMDLGGILAGNSGQVSYTPNPVVRIVPPMAPRDDVLINKTGSTNGFGAYVAFVPSKKAGIVLLANKNYPVEARVTAAYAILTRIIDAPSVDEDMAQ